jgi:hypothetical protein
MRPWSIPERTLLEALDAGAPEAGATPLLDAGPLLEGAEAGTRSARSTAARGGTAAAASGEEERLITGKSPCVRV